MSSRSHAAFEIWRARNARTTGDRAYLVYAILMIALVTIVPLGRAAWLSATSTAGIALLASSTAPTVTGLIVAALWAGALLLGRDRGPAVLPPFLTHALATSDLSRRETLRGPVLRAGLIVTSVTTVAAGLVGGSLASYGLTDLFTAAMFVVSGVFVGIITTVAWLAGQALPRAAVPLALGLLGIGAITAAIPAALAFTPWGWAGRAYPGVGSPQTLALLAALTAALVAGVPLLLNRLGIADLLGQAARWESATVHAVGMDFGAATAIYQGRPHLGRRVRAVRPAGGLTLTFLLRDAIGATRTPGRLVVSVLALASAGALIALAFAPTAPGWLLGAVAGALLFAGLGPLTDGVRHAASIASDVPLYGISDERLLANHVLFPLAAVVIILLVAVAACSIIVGLPVATPILSALVTGLLALFTRIGNALKGTLPPALLTPIPTPAGDLGAAARLAWALDGLLFSASAGAAAAVVFDYPVLLVGVAVVIAAVEIPRWRHRR